MSYVYSQSGDEHREFLLQVVTEVLETLLFLGPLHELPEHVTSASSPQGNKVCEFTLHVIWKIYLWFLKEYSLYKKECSMGRKCCQSCHTVLTISSCLLVPLCSLPLASPPFGYSMVECSTSAPGWGHSWVPFGSDSTTPCTTDANHGAIWTPRNEW